MMLIASFPLRGVLSCNDRIASAIPYYPFKGIDRFYDISGLLMAPALFKRTTDILVQRYREMGIDKIGGFDARGFVLGPPLALELQIPFFMLRKKSKMPNAICGEKYSKVKADLKGFVFLCVYICILACGLCNEVLRSLTDYISYVTSTYNGFIFHRKTGI